MNLLLTILTLFTLSVNAVLSDYEEYNIQIRKSLIDGNTLRIYHAPTEVCGFNKHRIVHDCIFDGTGVDTCSTNYINKDLVVTIRGIMFLYENGLFFISNTTEEEFKNYSISLVKKIFEEQKIFNPTLYPWFYPDAILEVSFDDIVEFQKRYLKYDYLKEREARSKILTELYLKRISEGKINGMDSIYFPEISKKLYDDSLIKKIREEIDKYNLQENSILK